MAKEVRRGLMRLWIAATPFWALYWLYRFNEAQAVWRAGDSTESMRNAQQTMDAAFVLGWGGPIVTPIVLLLAIWVRNGFRSRG